MMCPHGYVKDANGCSTCKCARADAESAVGGAKVDFSKYRKFAAEKAVGGPAGPCPKDCLKHQDVWLGDQSCDDTCLGCTSYWSGNTFDQGDCGPMSAESLAYQQDASPAAGITFV